MKKNLKLSQIFDSKDKYISVNITQFSSYFQVVYRLKEKTSRGEYKKKTENVQYLMLDNLDKFKIRTCSEYALNNVGDNCQTYASYSDKKDSIIDMSFYINLYLKAPVSDVENYIKENKKVQLNGNNI